MDVTRMGCLIRPSTVPSTSRDARKSTASPSAFDSASQNGMDSAVQIMLEALCWHVMDHDIVFFEIILYVFDIKT